MKKIIYSLLLLVIVLSCKTISIGKINQRIASNPIELGQIGALNSHLEINQFNSVAFPKYKQKIRLDKKELPYSKATFNSYKKACKLQGKEVQVKYIDSLPNKPHYVTFRIADKLTLINALRKDENKEVLDLLKYNANLKLVSAITLNLNEIKQREITEAEAVFLVNTSYKNYHIELIKNDKVIEQIKFSDGVVFAYELSTFCWKKERYTKQLIELVGEKEKCKKEEVKEETKIKF